ncbi:hypothetical protein [Anaeromicropila populeti]|uniref:Uncharacterized protein n=1 Tax=Anaeromicropila populeti TaxID=37658 RepID=A0A1I6LM67_9FIRM|nr:hypothetical protein [Anaeromicropila populeti]SFS04499.1 hypothetical protein SAMN05661086_03392 [Anaeromicropila populeti]
MEKLVIIINGRGGVGKDTLCSITEKYYRILNVSSITPIKEIAFQCGWNGEKDDKARKFLSDLKTILVEFNNLPQKYLEKQYNEFLNSNNQIMFVQIREGSEIIKFRNSVSTPCITLLIKRSNEIISQWGNTSDDEVENFKYDYCYDNVKSLENAEQDFMVFLDRVLSDRALHI